MKNTALNHPVTAFDPSKLVTAHRKPTTAEIRFGHGATHYADVQLSHFIRPDGTLKRRAKIDGQFYTRY